MTRTFTRLTRWPPPPPDNIHVITCVPACLITSAGSDEGLSFLVFPPPSTPEPFVNFCQAKIRSFIPEFKGRRDTVQPCALWGLRGLQAHGFKSCPRSEYRLGFLTWGNGFQAG
ncbi:hypothetical protein E2C01_082900 [Portunus trituberculatus]|uniref:Uncharacterized protein n=1 Tax=Portunus trituberculatus TaxID=210409 RepID=A0A5B7IR33_PORTR|nr:hypothetical protein [Portunus trituberculatus]